MMTNPDGCPDGPGRVGKGRGKGGYKGGGGARALPGVLVMTDEERLPDPAYIIPDLGSNCAIIIRHRDPGERRKLAEAARPMCHHRGVSLIVSEDARLAHRVGAAGVHLSDSKLATARRELYFARKLGLFVTCAVHGFAALQMAGRSAVDAAIVSPVFKTDSHPNARCLGVLGLARYARAAPVPVFALGGVSPKTWPRLNSCNVHGWAGIGAFQP